MDKLYCINIRYIYETIKKEGWPFIVISTYLFFEYVRPQSIYTWLDILPWSQLILILTIISLFFEKDRYSTGTILNKLMIAYALVVLLSAFFSQYPDISFSRLRTFFDWLLIYFLIVKIINNERRFFIFFLLFLLCSFKMSQHGFLSWAKRGFSYAGWGITGAPGWFHNSGEVGIQMCIFVPLAIAFIIATYKFLSKPWLVFFLLMPFTGIATAIASSSRGALVGLGAAGIRPLVSRPRTFLICVIVLSIGAVAIIHVIPEQSKHRFDAAGSDRTSIHRLERWRHGMDAMRNYPLLGIGFEAWTEFYSRNYQLEDRGTPLVHNIFVQCGSELGYSGLTVFILMIAACFVTTRKVRKLGKGKDDQFLAILSYGFDAALLGFLGSGFFITVLYYPYFWIHCAMTTCLHTSAQRKFVNDGDTL
ncbi:MAG: O-antigen ligase family protein [Deltaproteobacteria bacterium]|nr:O-antigen ligase family protein [Deltaproteobacteria bacterium]